MAVLNIPQHWSTEQAWAVFEFLTQRQGRICQYDLIQTRFEELTP